MSNFIGLTDMTGNMVVIQSGEIVLLRTTQSFSGEKVTDIILKTGSMITVKENVKDIYEKYLVTMTYIPTQQMPLFPPQPFWPPVVPASPFEFTPNGHTTITCERDDKQFIPPGTNGGM